MKGLNPLSSLFSVAYS